MKQGYCGFCGRFVAVTLDKNVRVHMLPADVGKISFTVCPGSRSEALKKNPAQPGERAA